MPCSSRNAPICVLSSGSVANIPFCLPSAVDYPRNPIWQPADASSLIQTAANAAANVGGTEETRRDDLADAAEQSADAAEQARNAAEEANAAADGKNNTNGQ